MEILATMTPKKYLAAALMVLVGTAAWAASDAGAVSEAGAKETQAPRIIRGNDRVIAEAKKQPPLEGPSNSFKFEEAPIGEVVRTMLGDLLKVDYVLYPPLNGSITLATRAAVSTDQALFLLESALQANGLAMVRDARGTYHVGKVEALKGISPGIRQITPNRVITQPGSGAIIVPLQYIGAAEMAAILRPMMPGDALLRVDNVRNMLVLSGNRAQAEGWLDIVNTFDVDLLKGMSVGLFPLKHASIKEVESALRLVSGGGGGATPAGAPAQAASAGAGAATAPGASAAASAAMLGEANPLFGALRIMPVERLNSILVVTPRASYLEEARRWIEKLDQPSDGGAEPQLHIYRVQNGNARHLAGVLSGIFGGTQPGVGGVTGVAPGLGTSVGNSFGQQPSFGNGGYAGAGASAGFGGFSGNAFGRTGMGAGGSAGFGGTQNRFGQQPGQVAGGVQQGMVAANLGGVRVMADELNNSILVWSTRTEFLKIESTLKRLDLPPTQVLIEASIIEVTLNDDLKYGLQWAFSDTHRGGSGSGVVGLAPAAAATGGFSYSLKDSLGNVRVALNALATKSLIKVISSPSLMVLDNQMATIAVGTQQPVRTGEINTSTTGTPVTSTSYQYKDTGVQLAVQPSVNAGDLVTMDINQSVTDVGDEDSVTGQRAFLQRQISSKVAVRSGEAIVLGGLIKEGSTSGRSGVPILSSLPVVGGLFGSTTSNGGRTELLVVITPKVVRADPEIREVSEELRDRLRGLDAIDLRGQVGRFRNNFTKSPVPLSALESGDPR